MYVGFSYVGVEVCRLGVWREWDGGRGEGLIVEFC